MKKIIFNCETITPLFLGEAKKEKVELRPPAIKAAIRFWWRAMHAYLPLPEMKRREAEIFGGGGNDARSAKFDIILSGPSKGPVEYDYTSDEKPKLIEKINKGTTTGIQYLMYSFFYLKKKGMYFCPATQFDVTFYFDNDNTHINQILASFWLLVFLGNIGERSRRGAGSFKVNNITDNDSLAGNFNFITCNLEMIRRGLMLIKGADIFNSAVSTHVINDTYSHIHNNEIYISNSSKPTWDEALNDIGFLMKKTRLDNTNHAILSKNDSAIFGLPIRHSDDSRVKPSDFERRGSPLIIKIIQVAEHNFRWVLIRLEGDFLPIGKNTLNIGGTANDSILRRFLNPTTLNMTKI